MRPQPSVESELRQYLWFAVFMLVIAAAVVAVLVVFVRFDVELQANVDQLQGTVFLTNVADDEGEYDGADLKTATLKVGQSIRLALDGSARIEVFEDSNAYAYLLGPVDWKLVDAERHGTALQHINSSEDADYRLIIEQTQGTTTYDFSQSTPPLDEIDFAIRLPDGEFSPSFACFQVTAPTETEAGSVVEIPCH